MVRRSFALLAALPISLASVIDHQSHAKCDACATAAQDDVSLLQLRVDEVGSQNREAMGSFAQFAQSAYAGMGSTELRAVMGKCYDGQDHALDPDVLHVAFVCDVSQLVGVEASLTSLILHSKSPDKLFVHVMVQQQWEKDFKDSLGIPHDCEGTTAPGGTFLRVNPFDPTLVSRSVSDLSAKTLAKGNFRGLDSVENYARFYMHTMMPPVVVVYLDADTIVQHDLSYMKKQLLAHTKTVGFVKRVEPEVIGHVLHSPEGCNTDLGLDLEVLSQKPTFNVGVYVVDLKRWAQLHVTKRVEQLVAMQHACRGMLWDGGSQPPLLLAFLAHPKDKPDDYMVFDSGYNYARLGYRLNLDYAELKAKPVLHWNGAHKAWLEDGYYKDLWTPYATQAAKVIRGGAERATVLKIKA